RRTLVERAADARYVPTGHLVYMRLGTLVGSPFDAERLASSGGGVDGTRDVMQAVNSSAPVSPDSGAGQYAFSTSGTLAFVTGGPQLDSQNELQWISRDGRAEAIPVPPPARAYFLPRISPDGRTIVVGTIGMHDQNLWKYDIAQRTLTRLTFEGR